MSQCLSVCVCFLWRCMVCVRFGAADWLFDSAPCASITRGHTEEIIFNISTHSMGSVSKYILLYSILVLVFLLKRSVLLQNIHSLKRERIYFNIIATIWMRVVQVWLANFLLTQPNCIVLETCRNILITIKCLQRIFLLYFWQFYSGLTAETVENKHIIKKEITFRYLHQ